MCSVKTILEKTLEIRLMDTDDLTGNRRELLSLLEDNLGINFKFGDSCTKEAVNKYSDMVRFHSDNTAIVLGAFLEEALVGFLWAHPREILGERRMHIAHLIVMPDFRSCGVGKKLLDNLEKITEEQGIRKLDLLTTVENEQALKFYERNGFVITRVQFEKELEQLEC
jgi:ribosomal protein S18 acetylase RimI-like enzyme